MSVFHFSTSGFAEKIFLFFFLLVSFKAKKKASAVLVDLTAAYYTVWHYEASAR